MSLEHIKSLLHFVKSKDNSKEAKDALHPYKDVMGCKVSACHRVKTTRLLHYHCLFCRKYSYHAFPRVFEHMTNCSSASSFVAVNPFVHVNIPSKPTITSQPTSTPPPSSHPPLSDDSSSSTDPPTSKVPTTSNVPPSSTDPPKVSNGIRVCWDTVPSICVVRNGRDSTKHYHCLECNMSNSSLPRLKEHVDKCKLKQSTKGRSRCQGKSDLSDTRLQAELICANTGTYLVRQSTHGPASPVHVVHNKDGWECTGPLCEDFHNFHRGSLNPSYICDHVLACVNRNLTLQPDLISNVKSFDSFKDDKELILAFIKTGQDFGLPIVKQFVPTMVDTSSTPRNLYYSVFVGDEKPKHYSKLGRVLVTYDRVLNTHKCDCGIISCIHKKVAVLVSETNPLVGESRPEDEVDIEELELAEQMMDYILEHKRIPFDVREFKQTKPKSEFSPLETKCYKCDADLVTSNVSNRGCIFTLYEKKTGIRVITKSCPSCSLKYRYNEHSDGYFNFNNNSFFSITLMEASLAAWTKNTSLSSFLDIMKVITDQTYNIHLLLNAVKAYLALKDLKLDEHLNCYRCGHFPIYLTYDVIRSVCFDVKPGKISNHEYSSSSSFHNNCSRYNLARGLLDKKSPHFNKNLEHFSVKLGQTLPPIVSSNNFSSIDPYTRPLISDDRPEEITLPLERIEQLVNSTNSYKHLKEICNSLNIDTRGGKVHMVARLLDIDGNTQLYSVVRKNFTKISGKSGGVLRGFCPHGVCYGLKFLTLPESVSDYTNLITSFQVQPSFNFSDIATTWANHMEHHYSGFFRPYRGRLGDPEDPKSEMLKDGRKTAVFNHNTFTTCELDVNNYDHSSVHPISLMSSVLSLFDIFHESNQTLADTYLRSVKCTNLGPYLNTSVAEQQNHVLALSKSYCTEMSTEQHILFVSYLTSVHNKSINDEWKRRVEKKEGEECVVDELGFLVRNGVDKSSARFDAPPTGDLKSPHPTPILQDPSGDSSALNSVVYSVALSNLGDCILSKEECLSHSLISFACGKSPYNQITHFRLKKEIDKQVLDADGSTTDPCSIFPVAFLPDLRKLGVLVEMSATTSLNMGIGLDRTVQSLSSNVDYVILTQCDHTKLLNGVRTHFDVESSHSKLRYDTLAFVSKLSDSSYSAFVRLGEHFYEISNTKSSLLSEHVFLEFARSACLVIFKLSTPVSDQCKPAPSVDKSRRPVDVYDFEPSSGFKRAQPLQAGAKRKKVKISVDSSSSVASSVSSTWLGHSDTGRLSLYSEQYRICQSSSAWYDDIIINSYGQMCRMYRSSSFAFQDTCLSSPYSNSSFSSVDSKFIQIVNPSNLHWFCISNALTFISDPHIVEIYDSLKTSASLENSTILDKSITRCILKLRPRTTVVRYVDTQVQGNSFDCGPLALGFLWALSKGHHPRQYEHLRGPMIRSKVRQSFIENRFVPPTTKPPRKHPKKTLRSFSFDVSSKSFVYQP